MRPLVGRETGWMRMGGAREAPRCSTDSCPNVLGANWPFQRCPTCYVDAGLEGIQDEVGVILCAGEALCPLA